MKRDVSADRRDTWGGDAMDVTARETNVARADGEIVWSWRPDAGASRNALAHCRERDDASSVARTATTKPGLTGESTYKP
jgi:hypothetical protein